MLLQNRRTQERAARYIAPMITFALAIAAVVAFARPAAAQGTNCGSEGIVLCGTVFNDTNQLGLQDGGDTGVSGIKVTACVLLPDGTCDASLTFSTFTDINGNYSFTSQDLPPGTYTVFVDSADVGTGKTPSPENVGSDDESDSDGSNSGTGLSFYTGLVIDGFGSNDLDFGFVTSKTTQPGTGTPGYWKNHPEAWNSTPYASTITVGGHTYTKAEAIAWLGKVGKDKRTTMFSSLVPAMLNVAIGNDASCVASTIAAADAWMAIYAPTGLQDPPAVPASSDAWSGSGNGEAMHKQLDAYNNGLLCAPHRN